MPDRGWAWEKLTKLIMSGGASFLSQIQDFGKESLKKVETHLTTPDGKQVSIILHSRSSTPDHDLLATYMYDN